MDRTGCVHEIPDRRALDAETAASGGDANARIVLDLIVPRDPIQQALAFIAMDALG